MTPSPIKAKDEGSGTDSAGGASLNRRVSPDSSVCPGEKTMVGSTKAVASPPAPTAAEVERVISYSVFTTTDSVVLSLVIRLLTPVNAYWANELPLESATYRPPLTTEMETISRIVCGLAFAADDSNASATNVASVPHVRGHVARRCLSQFFALLHGLGAAPTAYIGPTIAVAGRGQPCYPSPGLASGHWPCRSDRRWGRRWVSLCLFPSIC